MWLCLLLLTKVMYAMLGDDKEPTRVNREEMRGEDRRGEVRIVC
jgi:hypothetical protein